MDEKEVKNYVAFLLFIVLIVLSYLIFRPFLSALLSSIILAVIFYPVYVFLNKYLKVKVISAILVTLLVLIILIVPTLYIATGVVKEVNNIYNSGFISSVGNYTSSNPVLAKIVPQLVDKTLSYLSGVASSFAGNVPSAIGQFLIFVFTMFYLFVTGENVSRSVKSILPFKNKDKLIDSIKSTINAILYGFIIIAIVDFILALIGFYLLGISHAVLWAFLVGISVLIPFVGPTVVWIPFAIVKAVGGEYNIAIGLVVLGLVLSGLEMIGRPIVIGKRANIHPVAVLLGIVGGVALLGIAGMIIGPVILSVTFILIEEMMK